MKTNENNSKQIEFFNSIKTALNEKGYQITENTTKSITCEKATISFSDKYYFGRFGSQVKDWIIIEIDDMSYHTIKRRIEWAKATIEKVIAKFDELIQIRKNEEARENSEKNKLQEWRSEISKTFPEALFNKYGDEKEFSIILAKDDTYNNVVRIKQYYKKDFYQMKCDKEISADKLKRIIAILEESE
jgi:hypothetical protein